MAFYIPTAMKKEHDDLLSSMPEYAAFCKKINDSDMSKMDPAKVDKKVYICDTEEEPYSINELFDIVSKVPSGRIKKLLHLFFLESTQNHASLMAVLDNKKEETIIRLYAACFLMGSNDRIKEVDVKAKKAGILQDDDFADISEKFIDLYASAPQYAKQDDMIATEYMVCYCNKMRFLWYPLGDEQILDDICNFVYDFESGGITDIMILRCDRELSIMAGWYRWSGKMDKSLAVANHVINRPKYTYSYNLYKMACRCEVAMMEIEKDRYEDAARTLKQNLNDYYSMRDAKDFRSLNVDSYHESNLFLVHIIKTYELLEALTGKDMTAEKNMCLRTRIGNSTEEKICNIDIRDYRHQWKIFAEKLSDRLKHRGYVNWYSLISS